MTEPNLREQIEIAVRESVSQAFGKEIEWQPNWSSTTALMNCTNHVSSKLFDKVEQFVADRVREARLGEAKWWHEHVCEYDKRIAELLAPASQSVQDDIGKRIGNLICVVCGKPIEEQQIVMLSKSAPLEAHFSCYLNRYAQETNRITTPNSPQPPRGFPPPEIKQEYIDACGDVAAQPASQSVQSAKLSAEQQAHEEIARICSGVGIDTPDGTSIGAVRKLADAYARLAAQSKPRGDIALLGRCYAFIVNLPDRIPVGQGLPDLVFPDDLAREIKAMLDAPQPGSGEPKLGEPGCKCDPDMGHVCEFHRDAFAAQGAPEPPRISDEYDQKAVDVIQNLAMIVRRLAHKHPNTKLVDQALGYLRGEGLQGSVLREAAPQPDSGETYPIFVRDRYNPNRGWICRMDDDGTYMPLDYVAAPPPEKRG